MAGGRAVLRDDRAPGNAPACTADTLRLLARSRAAMWIYGCTQQRIVWANPGGLEIWQAETQGDVQGRKVKPQSRGVAQRLDNLRHALYAQERVEDTWIIYPHGVPRTIRASISLVCLEDGEDGLLFELLADAAQVTSTADLRATEARALEAINQAPLMISLMTTGGSWLMHNPAAEAFLRRIPRPQQPGADNYLALFADPAAAAALRARALARGWDRASLQIDSRMPRIHDVTLQKVVDPVTGGPALMLSRLDVTRAALLERKLAKALDAERAMSDTQRHFLSLTSHEFRTPLAIIAGSVRRLRPLAKAVPAAAERLESISAAVRRMQDAMEKTLWGNRVEAGRVAYNPDTTDVGRVIERAVAVQRELHPRRTIAVLIDPLPPVSCDSMLVEQVIDNLLSNAIKYSPGGEPVELRAWAAGDHVNIAVSDRGIGVPEADLGRLFSRFYRASNTQGIKGTGIGLMVVRHVVELHGGTIAFAAREGGGSEVVVRFPAD